MIDGGGAMIKRTAVLTLILASAGSGLMPAWLSAQTLSGDAMAVPEGVIAPLGGALAVDKVPETSGSMSGPGLTGAPSIVAGPAEISVAATPKAAVSGAVSVQNSMKPKVAATAQDVGKRLADDKSIKTLAKEGPKGDVSEKSKALDQIFTGDSRTTKEQARLETEAIDPLGLQASLMGDPHAPGDMFYLLRAASYDRHASPAKAVDAAKGAPKKTMKSIWTYISGGGSVLLGGFFPGIPGAGPSVPIRGFDPMTRGAILGLVVGLIVGGMIGAGTIKSEQPTHEENLKVGVYALFGAFIGMVLGVIAGGYFLG